MMQFRDKWIVFRGGGDLATGAIYRLHRAGFPLLVLELPQPLVVRRQVAVATAILQGEVSVEGLQARRVESVEAAIPLALQGIIPVLPSPELPSFPVPIFAVVDARMAKRNIDTHMAQAPLVVALGPGFAAGEDCHAVIETMRGHNLGRVLWQGSALPNTGTPGIVAGKGAERVLRAPADGAARWSVEIGDRVEQGKVLGEIAGIPVTAPFDGVVRGLIAPGIQVPKGIKIGDIDARGDRESCFTISDKGLAIGGGVLEAVTTRLNQQSTSPTREPRLSLKAAFDLGAGKEIVALVGGGGKTSLMFALAAALRPGTVTATTTRIFAAQMRHAPAVSFAADLSSLAEQLKRYGTALVVGEVSGEKVSGVPASLPAKLLVRPDVWQVVVEADGARMRPCKAPAEHEPVIPDGTTLLIPVAGIDALGKPVSEGAHRPERVTALTDLAEDDNIDEAALATLLSHPEGGLKDAPAEARIVPLLNKVETEQQLGQARRVARRILQAQPRISHVVLGAVQSSRPVQEVQRRVTAVVLAAGEANRMGQTKQLLPWGETTILGRTLAQLQGSLVHDILLVTGHDREAVAAEADIAGVPHIHNPDYAAGEMISSLQCALRELTGIGQKAIGAILVVLADQPLVSPDTYNRLLLAYWQGRGGLVAPAYEGKRGNPVLIDRHYFPALFNLPGQTPPRALLAHYPSDLHLEAVDSDAILHDIDTPELYERWKPAPPLS